MNQKANELHIKEDATEEANRYVVERLIESRKSATRTKYRFSLYVYSSQDHT